MKRIALALVFVATFTQSGCKTGPNGEPSIIKQAVDCGTSEVKSKLPAIVDVAATCLLGLTFGDVTACLGKLALDVGSDTAVVCGVRIVSGEAHTRAMAAPGEQQNASRVEANGRAYLEARQVHFSDGN